MRPINLAKRYGVLDGCPAIWNDVEAWLLTNRVWREQETFTIMQDAGMMSKEKFDERFPPPLPPMPKRAFLVRPEPEWSKALRSKDRTRSSAL